MRLAILSLRDRSLAIGMRNISPPLEDALCGFPDVTLVAPPADRRPSFRPSRPAWLAAILTVRRADTVFWIQSHVRPPWAMWGLAYARPTAGRSFYAIDPWEPSIRTLARVISCQRLVRAFVEYRQAYEDLLKLRPDAPVEWLPIGVSLDVFRDLEIERDIDIYSMGRRHEPLHQALQALAERRGLLYRYSQHPGDPATREELNELINRCRYFVTLTPNHQNPARTGSYYPVTSRFVEGAAAGARLLGSIPYRPEYEWHFPFGGVIECSASGADIEDVLDRADADPAWEATRVAVRDHVRATHGWEDRAARIHRSLASRPI